MIEFETIMYNITVFDDAFNDPDTGKIDYGGNGTLVSFNDICQQYNLTEDEDPEIKGPTPPVELQPKVNSSTSSVTYLNSVSQPRSLWTLFTRSTMTLIT